MNNLKHIIILAASLALLGACTHQKVDVTQFDDKDKSCSELKTEIQAMEDLENDIDEKTGVSGRNVGMALLF